jgi:hypothetical protein
VALDLGDIDPRAALAAGPVTAALLRSVKEQLVALPRPLGFGLLRRSAPGEFDGPLAQIGFACAGRFAVPGDDETAWRPLGELGGFETAFDRDMPAETVIDIEAVGSWPRSPTPPKSSTPRRSGSWPTNGWRRSTPSPGISPIRRPAA